MNYTSIEQSKYLLELGLDPHTSDCYWEHAPGYVNWEGEMTGYFDEPEWGESGDSKDLQCWSVDSLTNILKCCDRLECHLRVDKRWNIFAVKDGNIFDSFRIDFHSFDSIFDAYYTVLVWLLENNYIKKGDLNE